MRIVMSYDERQLLLSRCGRRKCEGCVLYVFCHANPMSIFGKSDALKNSFEFKIIQKGNNNEDNCKSG